MKPTEAPTGAYTGAAATLELLPGKKFVLTKGAGKVEGEISYGQDEVTLYPKSFNGLDHDAVASRNIDQVAKTGAGLDPAMVESIFEKARFKIDDGAKSITGVEEAPLKNGQQPYYNGLGALTKR